MGDSPSYIDYEAFLDPSFSPTAFANSLVLATNNASDTPLDLSTPLSRVLFDVQEVDTHIHTLTTKSAVPLLTHTKQRTDAGERIVGEVEAQVSALTDGYRRLEKEVIKRWEAAEEVRVVTERLWQTVRIGRSVARCLTLGRQLEAQMAEVGVSGGTAKRDGHRAMVRASQTILALRLLFMASGPGEEGEGIDRVAAVTTLKNDLASPAEQTIRTRSQQTVREFSMSSLSSGTTAKPNAATTYAQTEATKARMTSALLSLYLLSSTTSSADTFAQDLLIGALTTYLQTALTSSVAALSRSLTTLPTLDRTLLEVSARCQNIVALESLLSATAPPTHALLPSAPPPTTLLDPLLTSLETTSLPSYFWRSLASALAPRVGEILARGGVSARTLRSQKERVREGVRECVARGSQAPAGVGVKEKGREVGWERESAVMVGAVVGPLGR
ncbi:MAG: hypothetical protein M1832_005936 [Thelocarpon impressellum]|nr:MAG: hypothetical protein M1832_005936 [Thelocarpon impressellum]